MSSSHTMSSSSRAMATALPTISVSNPTISVSNSTTDHSTTSNNTVGAELTPYEVNLNNDVALYLNIISMICSVLVLFTYTFLRWHYRNIMNRVSMRLTVQAIVASFLFSIGQILSDIPTGPSLICTSSVWMYVFFDLLSVWLVTMIAFNLHIMFVWGRAAPLMFDKWYLPICIALSSVSFMPLFFNGYGWEVKEQTCWYTKDIGTGVALGWEFGTYYIWVFIATAYCIFAITVVLRKIQESADNLAKIQNSNQTPPRKLNKEERKLNQARLKKRKETKHANKVMKRVIWYPIVILGCNIINLVEDMSLSLTGSVVNFPMYILSFIACASQGILLSIMFCLDPAINQICREKKLELLQKYYVEYNRRLGRTVDLPNGGSSDGPSRSQTLGQAQESNDELFPPTRFETVMNWAVVILFLDWSMQKNTRTSKSESPRSLEEGQVDEATELERIDYIPYTGGEYFHQKSLAADKLNSPTSEQPEMSQNISALPTLSSSIQKPVPSASNVRMQWPPNSNQVGSMERQTANYLGGVPNDSSTASFTFMLHHRRGSASSFTSEDSETIPIELL
ncbi:hypothetical protein BC937DRAFT_87007 [Endogone sp. FLAS-F59071]|nr:hypothetical protein BC937DRAFT_87007 [Endogone sp. FLAS-F59071]|eukprot:RUS19744.1 hypothetical protein BC937DRAFT_87007 [Endogone sp. FLAS-F59071]